MDGNDATLGTMPGGRTTGLFVIDDQTPATKTACVYKSNAVPDGGNAEFPLAFQTLSGDKLGGLAVTTDCSNDWGVIIPKTGVYTVSLHVLWNVDADGWRAIGLRRRFGNGPNTAYLGETRGPAAAGTVTGQNVVATARFEQNDRIQLYGIQTSGAALTTIGDIRTSMDIQFVAP